MKIDVIIKVILRPESLSDCDTIECDRCGYQPIMSQNSRTCYNKEKRKAKRYLSDKANNFLKGT